MVYHKYLGSQNAKAMYSNIWVQTHLTLLSIVVLVGMVERTMKVPHEVKAAVAKAEEACEDSCFKIFYSVFFNKVVMEVVSRDSLGLITKFALVDYYHQFPLKLKKLKFVTKFVL